MACHVVRRREIDGFLALRCDGELLDVDIEVLGPRCDDGIEGGAHPHDVVVLKTKFFGDGVGDGGLETLTGLRFVVLHPRREGGLAGGNRQLAVRESLEVGGVSGTTRIGAIASAACREDEHGRGRECSEGKTSTGAERTRHDASR